MEVGNATLLGGLSPHAAAHTRYALRNELDARAQPQAQANPAADLLAKAAQCRRLAAGVCDHEAAQVLRAMADNYETGARIRF
jgi:hypothetical protein